MSLPRANPDQPSKRRRALVSLCLRGLGLVFFATVMVCFGSIPFFLGALAQTIFPRRIPPFFLGLLAVGAFCAVRYGGGAPPVSIGADFPVWTLLLLSLVLFIAFFSSGAAFLCEVLPRKKSPPSKG